MGGDKINILFVCKYNKFRSRIAEAYFKKANKNPKIKAKSAGVIKGNDLNSSTVKKAKKFGLNIQGKPQGLSSELMLWQNITVIVADDVPPKIFDRNKKYGKKIIVWKIKDVNYRNLERVEKTIKKIIKKVDKLNNELGKLK